jgi:membrane protease YdiL (CAAX protease family)
MRYLPWLCGAVLAGGAVFSYPGRDYVLIGLMLFLPLLDRGWRLPALPRSRSRYMVWAGLVIAGVALLAWRPSETPFALVMLLMAAIPEEWFFRAYFMTRLGRGIRANVVTSLLFSLVHGLARDWTTALLVFMPSLFYGWLYQHTRDLPLLVLVHALSNIIYALFLAGYVATWLPDLR